MRNGKIHATAACPGGGTASTEVAADFVNLLDILEDKTVTTGDDAFNCTVSIAKAMAEYHFNGADLVLTIGGKDVTFHH